MAGAAAENEDAGRAQAEEDPVGEDDSAENGAQVNPGGGREEHSISRAIAKAIRGVAKTMMWASPRIERQAAMVMITLPRGPKGAEAAPTRGGATGHRGARATSEGVKKTPLPMVPPTTSNVAEKRPSSRRRLL